METNRLRQFCTVAEVGNLRKAADLLGMTHGALSKSLQVLQQELKMKLLLPSGRGIVISDEGKKFYHRAKEVLKSVDSLKMVEQEKENKFLRIGSFEVFTTYFLRKLAPFIDRYNIELQELIPGELESAIQQGVVDFGITYEPIPVQGVEYLEVTSVQMSIFAKSGCFKNVPTAELPFVAPIFPIQGAPSGVKGLDGWPENLFPRKVKYKVHMMESAIELCRLGKCAVFLPEFIASLHNDVVKSEYQLTKRSFPQRIHPVKRSVFLVKRVSSEETEEMKIVSRWLRALE